jgi:transposase InsO family protein
VVTDNLSSHTSPPVRAWLARHRRIQQVFIPKAACWLNLREGWWRLLRRQALAAQTFADVTEITHAIPWVWGRQPPPHANVRSQ